MLDTPDTKAIVVAARIADLHRIPVIWSSSRWDTLLLVGPEISMMKSVNKYVEVYKLQWPIRSRNCIIAMWLNAIRPLCRRQAQSIVDLAGANKCINSYVCDRPGRGNLASRSVAVGKATIENTAAPPRFAFLQED